MAGVRERRALPAGCGRPLIRWHDLVVVNRCEREGVTEWEWEEVNVCAGEDKEIKWEWGRATGETWRVLERIVWWGMVYSKISNREIYINTPHFTLKFLGCYTNRTRHTACVWFVHGAADDISICSNTDNVILHLVECYGLCMQA